MSIHMFEQNILCSQFIYIVAYAFPFEKSKRSRRSNFSFNALSHRFGISCNPLRIPARPPVTQAVVSVSCPIHKVIINFIWYIHPPQGETVIILIKTMLHKIIRNIKSKQVSGAWPRNHPLKICSTILPPYRSFSSSLSDVPLCHIHNSSNNLLLSTNGKKFPVVTLS